MGSGIGRKLDTLKGLLSRANLRNITMWDLDGIHLEIDTLLKKINPASDDALSV